MNETALALLLLLGGTASPSQSPFDRYLDAVKNHRVEASELAFLRKCGVDASRASHVYGVSVGDSWTRSSNLAKAVYDTESDFFNSAEVWWQNGQAKAVDFWALSLDVGSESNTIYCLDATSRIRFAQSTNAYTPVDGGPGGWIYRQDVRYDSSGKFIGKSGHFVNAQGEIISRPKLGEDDKKNFDWVPDTEVIAEVTSQLRPK